MTQTALSSKKTHEASSTTGKPLPESTGRRQFLGYTGASLLAAVLPGCGGGDNTSAYAGTIAWARQQIAQTMSQELANGSAVSVALLKGNQIVWQEAFGPATNNVAATTQTRFNVGSVSKVVAALAALILRDRGLLDLDTPIIRYLPSFTMLSPAYAQITTRHLLSHASGLPGFVCGHDDSTFAPITGNADRTMQALANMHLKHLPGEMAVYSNDGFTMIEPVVQAVSGRRYTDFVQQELLAPLNMTNSGFLTSAPTAGSFAHPYLNGSALDRLEFYNTYASGGLSTTPADMMNLAQMLLGGGVFQGQRIVSEASVAEMGSDQAGNLPINLDPAHQWGLGWDNVRQPTLDAAGITAWEKTGGTSFFYSDFIVVPQAQLAVLVTGGRNFRVADDAAAFYPGSIATGIVLRALQEEGMIGALPATSAVPIPSPASAPNMAEAAGIYGNQSDPVQVIVNPQDGSLTLNTLNWSGTTYTWIPLNPGVSSYQYRSDGWWWSDNAQMPSYRFTTVSGLDTDGSAASFVYLLARTPSGSQSVAGQKLRPVPALSAAWQQRVGTQWQVNNESLDASLRAIAPDYMGQPTVIGELQGYLLLGGGGPILNNCQLLVPVTDDSARMAVNLFRDLNEIAISTVNGTPTMTVGSRNFTKLPG